MLAPARSDRCQRLWERSVLGNELIQGGDAVELLDRINIGIENPNATRGTGRRSDHCVWPLSPPRTNLRLIGRRIFEAVRRERLLVERAAGENGKALTRVFERGVERVRGRAGLRLRAHVIFPLNCPQCTGPASPCSKRACRACNIACRMRVGPPCFRTTAESITTVLSFDRAELRTAHVIFPPVFRLIRGRWLRRCVDLSAQRQLVGP